ncbi:hypothetical protein GFS31_30950 [Leptolyngbya sp. BL0902]|uniref:glycosyltransferase n=1 Tax=Leptolyngbya sp. BL0902 TaxID=1115757 RepID=UPI0018E8377B|nr:glycosyltransferase [Leptolyngbya sp. BL0902]QQE66397.1 hypothetical protein GFS31_30950 [Leptolyngbya sp. BL0902]
MVNETHPLISVIIPVFNDADCLKPCLQALAQQTYPQDRYEVIVVDNSPTPDPNLPPLAAQFPWVVLAHEPQRGSYAARNHGLGLAKGSIIAFTDADCLPAATWLERGADWLRRHPDCGFVAGQIRFFFQNPDAPTAAELYDSRHFLQQKTYAEEYHFGATANLFTFKSRFEAVGLFNSRLYSGGDREWGERVFAAGYPSLYADDVVIDHPARHSFGELRRKVLRVTVGDHELSQTNDQALTAFLAGVLPEFKPSLRYAVACMKDPTIPGWRRKLDCYVTYLALRYLKAGKRLQLYFSHRWS